ncbi:rRNA pseudouridine synthase [Candidatus Uhrbacteria bacterium]|jgi:23S rRNA pseudouridine2604 synthase|nr:rRNA pseudouridine synthase [Candidatus Uhrbacteria bacterium]MBT7716819.1 rRNA pseudouridine synthase [Candidatus Uhrbacteria bacterium]
MRLNKYIADSGFCSRRKADTLIDDGRVTIGNDLAKVGQQVEEGQKVYVDGELIRPRSGDVFIAFHKPYGVICTSDEDADNTVFDYIDSDERLIYIGRIDVESTGLLLLTNNGDIANKIASPKFEHEKEYVVTVNKEMNRKFLDGMKKGVMLDGRVTNPAPVKNLGPKKFKIILKEGRNRQIRRMCTALGYEVATLKRIRVMNVKLGELGPGNYRQLTKTERRELLSTLGIDGR